MSTEHPFDALDMAKKVQEATDRLSKSLGAAIETVVPITIYVPNQAAAEKLVAALRTGSPHDSGDAGEKNTKPSRENLVAEVKEAAAKTSEPTAIASHSIETVLLGLAPALLVVGAVACVMLTALLSSSFLTTTIFSPAILWGISCPLTAMLVIAAFGVVRIRRGRGKKSKSSDKPLKL